MNMFQAGSALLELSLIFYLHDADSSPPVAPRTLMATHFFFFGPSPSCWMLSELIGVFSFILLWITPHSRPFWDHIFPLPALCAPILKIWMGILFFFSFFQANDGLVRSQRS